MYTWRTCRDGRIVVRDGDGPAFVPSFAPGSPDALEVERVEARWGEHCRRFGGRYGLRDGCLQAHIKRESGGDPKARNPERQPGVEDDGVGLLQITNAALKAGYTDRELEDPDVNLEIGAAYLASLVRRYGYDFPKLAAAFNAGGVYAPRPGEVTRWGMHATPGHVDEEVRAYNYFLERGMSAEDKDRWTLSDEDRAEALRLVDATSTASVGPDLIGDRDTEPDDKTST